MQKQQKNTVSEHKKFTNNNSEFYRYTKRFCVCIGAACAISAAIVAFWKVLAPDTTILKICFVIAAFCIYVYGGLDTIDKCKKWGLID